MILQFFCDIATLNRAKTNKTENLGMSQLFCISDGSHVPLAEAPKKFYEISDHSIRNVFNLQFHFRNLD